MISDEEYLEIAKTVCVQIERNVVVNKPYLINIIQYGRKELSNNEANEIIKKMLVDGRIDENLALSRNERPYSFYLNRSEKTSLARIIQPIKEAFLRTKKLTITDASRLTGYSELVARTLLTHLLLNGEVDCSGDLESPVFYVPWDET